MKDKLSCLPLIDEIAGLAQLARREGYLAFEKNIKNCDNVMLQMGLELMVDGLDKFTIQYSFEDMINMSDTTGVELLKQLIIAQGLLYILNS